MKLGQIYPFDVTVHDYYQFFSFHLMKRTVLYQMMYSFLFLLWLLLCFVCMFREDYFFLILLGCFGIFLFCFPFVFIWFYAKGCYKKDFKKGECKQSIQFLKHKLKIMIGDEFYEKKIDDLKIVYETGSYFYFYFQDSFVFLLPKPNKIEPILFWMKRFNKRWIKRLDI